MCGVQTARYTQLLQFIGEPQSVPAFRFDCRDPMGQKPVQPPHGLGHQLLLRGFTGAFRGVKNPAAGLQNIQILSALKPQIQLEFP
ncbi:hypothetical protein D3C74_460760 [compost metagenome]